MNIGDLFFSFRGDGARLQADAKTQGATAGNTAGTSFSATFKKAWSGEAIGKGFVQGLGLAGGLGAVKLVSDAVSTVKDVIGDSIKAFNEEQASIAQLGTSLRANVPNWDGNTAAIERTIKAQLDLGFSDEEQRSSLALLVAATHDVTKAQELQAAAMDLARFKRVSLEEATQALTSIEAGRARGLAQLGINVKDYSTIEERVIAVEKVASGQAADFAQTNEGKLLVSQVKVNNAMEKFGSIMAGPVADGTLAAANALTDIFDILDGFPEKSADIGTSIANEITQGNIAGLRQAQAALQDATDVLKHPELGFNSAALNELRGQLATVTAAIEAFERKSQTDLDHFQHDLNTIDPEHFQRSVVGAMLIVKKSALDLAADYDATQRRIRTANDLTVAKLKSNADDLINKAFDPLITHAKLIATNAEIAANKQIIASKKSTDAQKTDARIALYQLHVDQAQYLIDLANTGQATSKAYKTGVAELKTEIKNATGPTKTYLQGVLDELEGIDSLNPTPTITVTVKGLSSLHGLSKTLTDLGFVGNIDVIKRKIGPAHSGGGPVSAGVLYPVNELGTELFMPNVNGAIGTHAVALASGATGTGKGDTNITVALPTTARPDPFEVATQLKRLRDFGVLG